MIELEIPVIRDNNGWQWLSSNHRHHWAVKARLTKQYRLLGRTVAQAQRLPTMKRARIVAIIHKATRRRFDPANQYPQVKAIIDGLVADYGLLPDDDHHHLTGPDMRAGEPRKVPCITLQIEELPAA